MSVLSGIGWAGKRVRLWWAVVCALVSVGCCADGASAGFTYTGELAPSGFGPAEILTPSGVAVADDGSIYVASRNNHSVQKFSRAGVLQQRWGGFGSADGKFNQPAGVAVDGGLVYVIDIGNHRVQKFTADGEWIATWGGPGPGSAPGDFNQPLSVAVSPQNHRVYVADSINDRIQALNPNTGDAELVWGSGAPGNNQLGTPWGVAIPDDGSGDVYVVDSEYDRVKRFNFAGTWERTWGQQGMGLGDFQAPKGIAAAGSGHVYVTESDNDRVQKFDQTGAVGVNLGAFGTSGSGPGQFADPVAVATDEHGVVYVTDIANHTVSRWVDDAVAPLAWFDAGPDSVAVGGVAKFTFSANQPNASLACSLDGAAFAACSSPLSLTGLAAGTHSLRVRATSAGGVTAAESLVTRTLTAVAAPNVPACADGKDNDADGKLDLADPGCANAADADEFNIKPPTCVPDQTGCDPPAAATVSGLKLARAAKGMRVRFALNVAATVRVKLARCTRTERRAGRIVCARYKKIKARTLVAKAGTTKLRLGDRRLRAGRYRVTVKPTTSGAKTETARLRIPRR